MARTSEWRACEMGGRWRGGLAVNVFNQPRRLARDIGPEHSGASPLIWHRFLLRFR